MSPPAQHRDRAPRMGVFALFFRFLKFGFLAYGEQTTQIDMIRNEGVQKERWVSPERFDRTLAVYQALPGPEAVKLCLYVGMVAGGRLGGIAAGLGFLLPSAVLMFALSTAYVARGSGSVAATAMFFGMQPAMLAIVVASLIGVGRRALSNRYLAVVACFAGFAHLAQAHLVLIFAASGICGVFFYHNKRKTALLTVGILLVGSALWSVESSVRRDVASKSTQPVPATVALAAVKMGVFTLGGAYTAIPWMRQDAVESGWATETELLDGLALALILPAPPIIFTLFVGYLAAGAVGAILMWLGVFLPVFALIWVGCERLEKCIGNPGIRGFLDGMTAGAVGLAVAAVLWLAQGPLLDPAGALIFLLIFSLYRVFRSRWATPLLMIVSAVIGLAIF